MAKTKDYVAKVRIDEATLKRWTQAAEKTGLTLSAWIRLRVEGVEEIEVLTPAKAA